MLAVVVITPLVAITTLGRIQHVNQLVQLHHHRLHRLHHLLVVAHFCILMLNTEGHAVKLYQLQLQVVANLLLVQILHRHHRHLQPLIAILASATEALGDRMVMELCV